MIQEFRTNKIYLEPVDKMLRKHMQTLKDIYKKAAHMENGPAEDSYMSISEFIELITFSEVCDEQFTNKEIGTIFNLSMMTQVDEIFQDRHMQMSFLEFVEAICRVADKVIFNTSKQQSSGNLIATLTKKINLNSSA